LDKFRTLFDKSRSVFTGISAGISGISENRISRYLPVFFPKREKKPWSSERKLLSGAQQCTSSKGRKGTDKR
jgi:hypothetical protein